METLLRLQGLPQSLMALLTLTMEIRVTTSSSNASEGKRKASRQLSSAGREKAFNAEVTLTLRLW